MLYLAFFILLLFFCFFFFFFFNDPATTEIYTLSLHDALPILGIKPRLGPRGIERRPPEHDAVVQARSEEHTSELQSQFHLVCRLLLEKKKKKKKKNNNKKKDKINHNEKDRQTIEKYSNNHNGT